MGQGKDKPSAVYTEDGELIEGVTEIKWHADASNRPKFHIAVVAERVEIVTGEEKQEAST